MSDHKKSKDVEEEEFLGSEVAIVGMAARFPDALTVDEYWSNIEAGVESVRSFSDEELLDAGESPARLRRSNYVRSGVVMPNVDLFDADFFGLSPKEAGIMDPQHRQFLECTWEAIEDSGHAPDSFEGSVGVFAGCGMASYFAFNVLSNPDLVDSVGLFLLRHTGNDKDFLATRASYCFDLKGPSVNVQTACSTSLVATHLACQSLLSGESDLALAGGVTIEIPQKRGYLFEEGEILSPTGHCHPFDYRAQGTLFGSGVGVVALRRLEDAIADGDHIHAVIKGSAVNNDGSGKVGYLAPSVDGQAACVAEALEVAGVDARTIEYVECHGTGTYMGDPIELAALTQAFRRSTDDKGFCHIGSVKSNIGHLDTAAGVAGLIKAVMAIQKGQIPGALNFEAPNPNLDLEESPFQICVEGVDWTESSSHPRRASVNSLGVGGTNAHLVLEQAPPSGTSTASSQDFYLLPLFAMSKGALNDGCDRLADYLRLHADVDLADVSWTLITGRKRFQRGRTLVCKNHTEAIEILETKDPARLYEQVRVDNASLTFMFPGGGAHYPGMARGLYESESVFRDVIDRGVELLSAHTGVNFLDFFLCNPAEKEATEESFLRMSRQLPAIFLVEYALAKLWLSRGVKPTALIGHSVGENTAACVAGVLSFEDALLLVLLRGQLFEKVSGGGMLAIPLSADAVLDRLPEGLELAAVNAPQLSVVSGPEREIAAFEAALTEEELGPQRLAIPVAAHSNMLDPILDEFRTFLRGITLSKPEIPFISNLTGGWITPEEAVSPEYWVDHLRGRVRFSEGISTLFEQPGRIFLEVGPGRTLSSFARQDLSAGVETAIIPSLRHSEEVVDDVAFLMGIEGRLVTAGIDLDLERRSPGDVRRKVRLPSYAFQHESYWIQPGNPQKDRSDLDLQRIQEMEDWGAEALWIPELVPASGGPPNEPRIWLIFEDEAGLGARIRSLLEQRGHRVISVRQGDGFYTEDETHYVLSPEHGEVGYGALFNDLERLNIKPQRILHMWLVTADESARPGSSFFHRNIENGFYSLFFMARVLGGSSDHDVEIDILANGLFEVYEEGLPYPEKATVLGPAGVIPREYHGVKCRTIDIELPDLTKLQNFLNFGRPQRALDRLAESLVEEVVSAADADPIAYRGGQRLRRTFAPLSLPEAPPGEVAIKEGGVYVITGGLGGLGLVMARSIAQTEGVCLVLVSRKGLSQTDSFRRGGAMGAKEAAVHELIKLGARVTVMAADVTDLEAMRDVFYESSRLYGQVNGVIHAAGVVDDALIQAKTEMSIDMVFSAKVHGTQVLDTLLRDQPLDFFVLFSSTSTAISPLGQVDYVAANAFLNAFAKHDRRKGLHSTQAINWGLWKDVGMAAENLCSPGVFLKEALPVIPYNHPLLKTRTHSPSGELALSGEICPDRDWLLDEHRTKEGLAVLPGTGYLELAHAVISTSEYKEQFELRNLIFFKPLSIEDGKSREVRVELSSEETGKRLRVRSHVTLPDGRTGWEDHAEGEVMPMGAPRPPAVNFEEIAGRCQDVEAAKPGASLQTGQGQFLTFGPRFQVLRRQAYGVDEAIAELELDSQWREDLEHFRLHPGLLDLATGFAMKLIGGYGKGDDLWVPVSYESVRVYQNVPTKIYSWVRRKSVDEMKSGVATFDIGLFDEGGVCLIDISGFSIRRIQENGFANLGPPTESELELDEVAASSAQSSPSELALSENLRNGIHEKDGGELFRRILRVPKAEVYASSLRMSSLISQADRLAARSSLEGSGSARFSRPHLENEYIAPRDEVETQLATFWQELLGVEGVGVRDAFFDLGGHSLIAVRLFAMIKKKWGVEYPISVLFDAPTIEACAELIRPALSGDEEEAGIGSSLHRPKYTYLVPMHTGQSGHRTPFFLIAGMFGNVLNLRHLAHLVGAERPFYGLQARGLYGDHRPHETFVEMAQDYLAEIRTVQGHGPYFLGGFSGGGIAAYEIARQLLEMGEEVKALVFLDTPLPMREVPSRIDKLKVHRQNFMRRGPAYLADFVRKRLAWELGKLNQKFGSDVDVSRSPAEFRSNEIRASFERALPQYVLEALPIEVQLFRPRQKVEYDLGRNRALSAELEFLLPDNGWTDWVEDLAVSEVPGTHDSMVLEPNVRVLASKLRVVLDQAEAKANSVKVSLG